MRKRVHIALAVLFVAITGVIAWQVLHPQEREPVYQGKRLSVWLQSYNVSSPVDFRPEDPEADEAVRQIGTNAIPALLHMLRAHDSKLTPVLSRLLNDQHFIGIHVVPAYFRTKQAAAAFHALGANASNAVPILIHTYRDNLGPDSRCGCAEALGWIGPVASAAIPDLMSAATNSDYRLRSMAVEALGHIHAEPGLVLPVLTKSLQDSDIGVRLYAVNSLAAFRSDAEPAVPALTQLLKDPLGVIRTYAAKSLMKIDSQAAAKAGWRMLVLESLGDANPGIRFSAANGLGDFGAEVRDAVPALVRLLGDPEWIVRQAATNALKQIDPVAAAKAGVK